ncbi:uncharacterized protein [Choristoneura fumiferana]|uniref:uncharacterized protein n=1 Tax=Choristoneura fumiferana TaxID=7141 RepID=UPI003D1570E5
MSSLLRSLPWFYLSRFLRLFPLLAAAVLLQASLIHRVADGPGWHGMAKLVGNCRRYCACPYRGTCRVDMQLHVVSPLVLFWVWAAAAPRGPLSPPPCSPPSPLRSLLSSLPLVIITCHALSFATFFYVVYIVHPCMQADWDNHFADSMNNSFRRSGWSLALCWMILACVHGYGGPVNWFLSLRLWKFVARISYAMYLYHYLIQKSIRLPPSLPFISTWKHYLRRLRLISYTRLLFRRRCASSSRNLPSPCRRCSYKASPNSNDKNMKKRMTLCHWTK